VTANVLIGIDDTDMPDTPGTGRVARGLARALEIDGVGISRGVTRHQLLIHPAIPYTSHNSALCLLIETSSAPQRLLERCVGFLEDQYVQGSDPAVCVAPRESISPEVVRFGRLAQHRVLEPPEAFAVAAKASLYLQRVGGSHQGAIGALAAAGLRAGGLDGRFVELRGIREISGVISVGSLLARTDIVVVEDPMGEALGPLELVDTLGWVRPNLIDGRATLRVQRQPADGRLWVPIERRHGSTTPPG
jgi:hypothetical protein